MLRRLRDACLAALCLVAAAIPAWGQGQAQGQAVAGVLNGFGFFGTWAVQCGAPPGPANIVETVAWTGHEPVEFTASAAPGSGNHYRVISAQLSGPTTLLLQVELNRRSVENLTIVKYGNDRLRTMTTQNSEGLLVQDGVVKASGRQTPWLQKCR